MISQVLIIIGKTFVQNGSFSYEVMFLQEISIFLILSPERPLL